MTDLSVEVVVQMRGEDVHTGTLWAHRRRGAESATFIYRDDYLARPGAYELDPSLPLHTGQHQTPGARATFGAFSDCAPDGWGRRLIARNERARTKRTGGAERGFGEMEYLLGARDDARQGALRFRTAPDAPFLAQESQGVPPLIQLPTLLGAADRLDRDEAGEEELQILLRGGSSLGGARPKAHVIDGDGNLAIAKFPSPSNDQWDVIRWEAVALQLACEAGIRVPRWSLEVVDDKPVLLVSRFDRNDDWRIGYVSAMTMLELDDGDHGSYLDIGEAIERSSPQTGDDLRELWRRIVFTVLISNTDNHLRNHGFLRTGREGWTLSPAFDLNPNPDPGRAALSTSITGADDDASLESALEIAGVFGLRPPETDTILAEVRAATTKWRVVAKALGIPSPEIDRMAPAFSMSD